MSNIKIGMWLMNSAGIYEVTDICNDGAVYASEVIFADDSGENYTLGPELRKTRNDLAHMELMDV